MEGHAAVKKVIEEGAFRAEVDVSDLHNVKIAITMNVPLYVSDYNADSDPWHWENDIAHEVSMLRYEVNEFISRTRRAQREREAVCAAS